MTAPAHSPTSSCVRDVFSQSVSCVAEQRTRLVKNFVVFVDTLCGKVVI